MIRPCVFTLFDVDGIRHDYTEIVPFPDNDLEEHAILQRLKENCGFVLSDQFIPVRKYIGQAFEG